MTEQSSTDHLITAIDNKDVEGVKQALLDGADVNRRSMTSSDPVWQHSILRKDYATGEDQAIYNKMWEMIVPMAKNVAVADEISSHRGLSSRIFNLHNTEAASLVVMAAIKETKGNVPVNLPEMFSLCGDAKDPYHPAREGLKRNTVAAHDQVSDRLSNPTTPFEKAAAEALSATGKKYWLEPLSFPDLADLPVPTQQCIDAIEQISRAGHEAGELMGPYFTQGEARPMPEGVRSAFRMALDEAREANNEINQLRDQGRLGIKRPRPHSDLAAHLDNARKGVVIDTEAQVSPTAGKEPPDTSFRRLREELTAEVPSSPGTPTPLFSIPEKVRRQMRIAGDGATVPPLPAPFKITDVSASSPKPEVPGQGLPAPRPPRSGPPIK
jgi:hypothetical protein